MQLHKEEREKKDGVEREADSTMDARNSYDLAKVSQIVSLE